MLRSETNQWNKVLYRSYDIDGKHVMFAYHRRRFNTRVYVSQLPIGINEIDLREAFSFYGELLEINYVTKLMYGRRIDTGDRVLIFRKINRHIPSYIFVRGWRAFVKYNGQPQTCRVCGSTTRFAIDCPVNKKDKRESENKEPESPGDPPTSMDINVIPPHEGFQTRSKQEIKQLHQDCFGSAGSSSTGDREDDDLQSIDSLNEDQHAQNMKAWEKLPEKFSVMPLLLRNYLSSPKPGPMLRIRIKNKLLLSLTVLG